MLPVVAARCEQPGTSLHSSTHNLLPTVWSELIPVVSSNLTRGTVYYILAVFCLINLKVRAALELHRPALPAAPASSSRPRARSRTRVLLA